MADFCGLGRFFGGFYAVFVYVGATGRNVMVQVVYLVICILRINYFFIPFVFAVVNLFDFGFGVR